MGRERSTATFGELGRSKSGASAPAALDSGPPDPAGHLPDRNLGGGGASTSESGASDLVGRPSKKAAFVAAALAVFAATTVLQYLDLFVGSRFAVDHPILVWATLTLMILLPMALVVSGARLGLARIGARFAARADSEHEQILIRIVLVVAIMVYFHIAIDPATAPTGSIWAYWIMAVGICISWGFALHIVWFTNKSIVRRLLAMNADLWINSLVLYVGGALAAVMYPIYLWVTFGNGFRYGARYLVLSAAISLIGFTYVLTTTPYWQQSSAIGYGLLVALVCLPAYVVSLIRKLTEAKVAAEAASRAKSRFLATISHELRTPLNSIIGLTGLIKKSPLDSEQRSMVRSVRSSARTLLSLINNVLDFSKLESGRLTAKSEPFDLYALMAEVESMFTVQARAKGLGFSVYVDPAVPPGLVGDPDHLRDVMVNLVGNGLKFTEAGRVTAEVHLRVAGADRVEVEFRVTDTGIGIPDDKWDAIFDSFSQADDTITRRYGGTGLGLSIARQLVGAMGGSIGVSSEVGRGSIFNVQLPFDTHATVDFRISSSEHEPVFVVTGDGPTYERVAAEVVRRRGRPIAVADPARLAPMMQGAAGSNRTIVVFDERGSEINAREFVRLVKSRAKKQTPILCLIRESDEDAPPPADYLSSLTAPLQPDLIANMLHAAGYVSVGVASINARPKLAPGQRRSLNILVAEDNLVNRRVVAKILESAGHTVDTVENGEAALAALDNGHFDLVLMDLNMPEMSGAEAAKLYRFASIDKPHLPIVALTADATPEGRKRSEAAGMDDYIVKPVEADDLLRVVDRWGGSETERMLGESGEEGRRDGGEAGNVRQLRAFDAPPKPPIVETAALDALRALGDGNEFLRLLADDFLADSKRTIEDIVEAVSEGDTCGVRDGAHALRSSAAHFGARRLHGWCVAVGDVTESDLLSGGDKIVKELRGEFDLVQSELSRLLEPPTIVAAGE